MMTIRKAVFTRMIPNDGEVYGEVKVLPEGEKGTLLAWFVPDGDGGFRLKKLIRKEEELELDWYGNDLHDAFEDVTESRFSSAEERGAFAQEVLAHDAVLEEMRKRFAEHLREYGTTVGAAAP